MQADLAIVLWHKTLERLEQQLDGVATPVPYKSVELKLQRPFGSDFDDF